MNVHSITDVRRKVLPLLFTTLLCACSPSGLSPNDLAKLAEGLPVKPHTPDETVQLGMGFAPAPARAGETVTLLVKIQIAPAWHIYSTNQIAGPYTPTTLKLALPNGISAVGDWIVPTPKKDPKHSLLIYEGTVVFGRRLRIAPGAAGALKVSCDFGYQTCDAQTCLRPTTAKLEATVEVAAAK